ncbi:SepM family pheromone-processing serine protease [Bacillus sp. EAC]|uniref:SepM family pheromone-processing serine protease n=1 Tax=Bacillus sp. EAC TaxID=1978338 RepID=UPI000B436A3E|nr:SepM family pheromone-processing serine protease [Bacillus sp. EAC]
MEKRIRILNVLLVFGIILVLLVFIPLPYYVTKPGLAEPLRPYVKVEGANKDKGEFMMTTVSMSKANIYSYIGTLVNSDHHLYKTDEIMVKGESNEDYQFRQLRYMEESKQAAIINAYKQAGKHYQVTKNGIIIVSIIKGMPAFDALKLGDVITKINKREVDSAKEFTTILSSAKAGTRFNLQINRNGKTKNVSIKTKPFQNEPNRAGLGVSIVENIKLSTNPKVKINSEEIGGPSAGLMFALEIYDQLEKESLAKGHEIAGTGTIDNKGMVGPIGGISQKIVAASKSGAEIFFAPYENGKKDSNYNEAVKSARAHHLKIKVIPINSYHQAIAYLEKLK